MYHATLIPTKQSTITQRAREIQSRWSPDERQQRAELGRRRRNAFLQYFLDLPEEGGPEGEQEIWAVGALSDDDLQRIAG